MQKLKLSPSTDSRMGSARQMHLQLLAHYQQQHSTSMDSDVSQVLQALSPIAFWRGRSLLSQSRYALFS